MPVTKLRTLDDARRRLWLQPGDPRIWDALVRRWRLHRFFSPPRQAPRAPGVFKYRSIAEKQQSR